MYVANSEGKHLGITHEDFQVEITEGFSWGPYIHLTLCEWLCV